LCPLLAPDPEKYRLWISAMLELGDKRIGNLVLSVVRDQSLPVWPITAQKPLTPGTIQFINAKLHRFITYTGTVTLAGTMRNLNLSINLNANNRINGSHFLNTGCPRAGIFWCTMDGCSC